MYPKPVNLRRAMPLRIPLAQCSSSVWFSSFNRFCAALFYFDPAQIIDSLLKKVAGEELLGGAHVCVTHRAIFQVCGALPGVEIPSGFFTGLRAWGPATATASKGNPVHGFVF